MRTNNLKDGKISVYDKFFFYYDFGDINDPSSIYIQGQLHSNEVNSMTTLYKVVDIFRKAPPPIPLRIVPMCNPIGWNLYIDGNNGRTSYPNCIDWNRIFKTSTNDAAIEMKLSETLLNLSNSFNYVIDVHTPEYGFPHVYTIDIHKRLLSFDDIPYIISRGSNGAFEDYNSTIRNVNACTLELPSYKMWDLKQEDYWSERIVHEVLSHTEKKPIKKSALPIHFGYMKNYYPSISGVPVVLVEPNKVYPQGTPIVKVISSDGKVQIISCTEECIPLCFRKRGIINSGNWVVRVLSFNHKE